MLVHLHRGCLCTRTTLFPLPVLHFKTNCKHHWKLSSVDQSMQYINWTRKHLTMVEKEAPSTSASSPFLQINNMNQYEHTINASVLCCTKLCSVLYHNIGIQIITGSDTIILYNYSISVWLKKRIEAGKLTKNRLLQHRPGGGISCRGRETIH